MFTEIGSLTSYTTYVRVETTYLPTKHHCGLWVGGGRGGVGARAETGGERERFPF